MFSHCCFKRPILPLVRATPSFELARSVELKRANAGVNNQAGNNHVQLRLAAGLDLQHQIQNSAGEAPICLLPVMEDEPAYKDQVQQARAESPMASAKSVGTPQ